MAVTITSTPAAYCLSKEPVKYSFSTDEYVITAPVKASVRFSFVGNPVSGEKLRLNSNEIFPDASYIEMTFVTVLGTGIPGFEIKTKGASQTVEDWIFNQVVPGLISNPFISNKYNVWADGDEVVIEAFQSGASYTFTHLSMSAATSGTTLDDLQVAGVAGEFTENYKLKVRLNLETAQGSTEFHRSAWFFYLPNEDGTLTVDLSDKVDEMFSGLSVIAAALFGGMKNPGSARRFFIEAGDHFGATPFEIPTTVSSKILMLKGSMRDVSPAPDTFATSLGSWLTKYTSSYKHSVYQGHPAWLSAIIVQNILSENILYKAKVYYTDGTNATTTISTITTSKVGELWTFQAGFNSSGLASLQPSKTPHKYELWLEGAVSSLVMIAKHTIYLLPQSQYDNCIMYHNFCGVWESRSVTTIQRQSTEMTKQQTITPLPLAYNATYLENESYDVSLTNSIELATGAFHRFDIAAIKDLLLSKIHHYRVSSSIHRAATLQPVAGVTTENSWTASQYESIPLVFKLKSDV